MFDQNFRHSAMKVQGDEWEGYGETQGNTVTNCGEEIGGQRLCLASPRVRSVVLKNAMLTLTHNGCFRTC